MKKIFTIILLSFISIFSHANNDTTKIDTTTYFLNKATNVDSISSYYLSFGGQVDPYIVIFENKVRILFTLEEVKKINENYQLNSLMSNVIEKYGKESDIEIGVINSLKDQVYILEQKIKDREGRLEDKDKENEEMGNIIKILQEKVDNNEEIKEELTEENEGLKDDLRKQKIKTIAVAIGEGLVILLLLIVLI
jgi:predicted unusual protein kinase regulating ubiquinone biosynthesis (AarF/ABC1/UbiB family)